MPINPFLNEAELGDICLVRVFVRPYPDVKIWGKTTRQFEIVYKKRDIEINEDKELRERTKRSLKTTSKKDIFLIVKIELIKIVTHASKKNRISL